MLRRGVPFLVLLGATSLAAVACSVSDINGGASSTDPTPPPPPPPPCSSAAGPTLSPQDPATLPKCACAKGGTARCVSKAKLPAELAGHLEACSEVGPGACIPDSLVRSGGAAPTRCSTSFGEGRCMSLCVPEIAANASVLDRGQGNPCAEDERCAPCRNPVENNASTGLCELGVETKCEPVKDAGTPDATLACPYEGPPLVDVNKFPACGAGMRCVPSNLVPATAASMLAKCATGLCAPEKAIAAGGQYRPTTCKSAGGIEGRCFNVGVPAVGGQAAGLPQDVCATIERCVPCFNPIDGKSTGACSTVSCDAPRSAPTVLKSCCKMAGAFQGKCVPKSAVPQAALSMLGNDEANTCDGKTDVCAPTESLDPAWKPATCKASSFLIGSYTGVCLSDCLDFGVQGAALAQGNCTSVQSCVPCTTNGKPTGAPGCPGAK